MKTEKKKEIKFAIAAIVAAVIWVVASGQNVMSLDLMNGELLMFNYSYGFIPRAFVGQIYAFTNLSYTYEDFRLFCIAIHVLLSITMLCLWLLILKKVKHTKRVNWISFLVLLGIIASFSSPANLGRSDEWLIVIALLSTVILIYEKGLFLLPFLAGWGVIIHEGYTFLYANVLLAGLAYKYFKTNKKKYLVLAIISFIVVSVLFLYFAFIGNHNEMAYQALSTQAKEVIGDYYYDEVFQAELLGVNLFVKELKYHPRACIELALWVLIMLPFVKRVVRYVKGLWQTKNYAYMVMVLGGITTLPEYILKIDYGRWTMALLIYYLLITFIAIGSGDKLVLHKFEGIMINSWNKSELTWAKYGYLFTNPFGAQAVCSGTYLLYFIFHYFLLT